MFVTFFIEDKLDFKGNHLLTFKVDF